MQPLRPLAGLGLALVLALLPGCSSPEPTGSARFVASLQQAVSVSDVSRVTVTSSGPGIPSVTVELARTGATWGGIIGNLPAGPERSFAAQAFDSGGTLIFEGEASGVTIIAGQTVMVAIVLQELNAPPPFNEEAPVIDSLIASSAVAQPGETITLQAMASDPNGGALTYAWTATGGGFTDAASPSTSWTAPVTSGVYVLTLEVSDPAGLTASISLSIRVGDSEGEAELDIQFNTHPRVAGLTSSLGRLTVNETTSVSVSASDQDGDALSYAWSADCAGTFADPAASTTGFTPAALPAEACNNCRLTVSVSDGRGGQSTGSVALCVTEDATSSFPPYIVRSYRSSNSATPGQVITYEVEAADPQGRALTFSWSSNVGTPGAAQTSATRSRMDWTAPACVNTGVTPTMTATVTNTDGESVTRQFTVTGLPGCAPPPDANWVPAGDTGSDRLDAAAAVLASGKVLLTGGYSNQTNMTRSDARIYDPATGTWSLAGTMTTPRYVHTATLLPSGKVLVAGGFDGQHNSVRSAEVYDPATGTWTPTGDMNSPRTWHSATLLPSGKVLVAGDTSTGASTSELYDPSTNSWTPTGNLQSPRGSHAAVLLPQGKVLITGGYYLGAITAAEIYDPATGLWTQAASMVTARNRHSLTILPNGQVLAAGGLGHVANDLLSAELYDPASNTWTETASLSTPHYSHRVAPLLPSGKVMVIGRASAELYDPVTQTWSPAGNHVIHRSGGFTVSLLPSGRVLMAGGHSALAEISP